MIRSVRHRGLKRLFERDDRSRLRPDLTGDLKGFWSVTVSRNWRIVFRFDEGDAFDVNFIDYH